MTNPILALLGGTLFLPLLIAYLIAVSIGFVVLIAGPVNPDLPRRAKPSGEGPADGVEMLVSP